MFKLYEKRTGIRVPELDMITSHTPFRMKMMARFTLPLIFWSKFMSGNKFAGFLFYIFGIPGLLLAQLTHKLILPFGKFYDEKDQDEWEYDPIQWQSQPKLKKFVDKTAYPAFAVQFSLTQLEHCPRVFPRLHNLTLRMIRPLIGKTNYVQQMGAGIKNIPRDKAENYLSMKGGRWTTYLNNRSDRWLFIIEPHPKYNVVDVDHVRKLYNETQI